VRWRQPDSKLVECIRSSSSQPSVFRLQSVGRDRAFFCVYRWVTNSWVMPPRGAGLPLLLLVFMLSKKPPKMVLRRMMSPSPETGAVFDAALSGELLRDCDLVSVRAVQENCDEKGGS
jgi:hypothetical protein